MLQTYSCAWARHETVEGLEVLLHSVLHLAVEGVSGHPHTLAALPPRKEPSVPTEQEARWAPQSVRNLKQPSNIHKVK